MSRQTGVQLSIILDRLKESLNYEENQLFFSTAKCLPNICMIFKFILLQKTVTELKKFRDQWRKEDPLLPYLDDNILLKMKNFIAECVQISWRMVNQLPPIKITQANKVHGERFEEFFEMEEEEVTERASTVTIQLCLAGSNWLRGRRGACQRKGGYNSKIPNTYVRLKSWTPSFFFSTPVIKIIFANGQVLSDLMSFRSSLYS